MVKWLVIDKTMLRRHSKYSTESRGRKILEQEVAVEHMKEKRADLDEFLQERVSLEKKISFKAHCQRIVGIFLWKKMT